MFQRFVPGLLGVVLCAAVAAAQATMSVSGGLVLTAGESVEITYSNPARANGTITVTVDDGEFPNPTYQEIVIHLDARGVGKASWTVPDWWCVHFNADGVREIAYAIL